MNAVADQLRVEILRVKDDAGDAGLAMVEAAHGVEGVGSAGGSGCDGCAGLLRGRVGVAEADTCACLRGIFDQVQRAGSFRGDGDEPDVAAGGLLHSVEQRDGRRLDAGWRVHASFGVRDERAFEMNADRAGNGSRSWRLDGVGDAFQGAQSAVDRCGHRGGR